MLCQGPNQRKIWKVENSLDELNEEFLQLTTEALKLQKDEPDRLSPSEGDPLVSERLQSEANSPDIKSTGTRALKSDQALLLEVRRTHIDQQITDLEWELALLLQVSESHTCPGRSLPSLGRL